MASINISDYESLYIKTAYEYLDAMQASLVLIHKNNNNPEAIETIYRSAHSLKSQSLVMGYKNTASISEFIEHTLKAIKENKFMFTEKIYQELKSALEKIELSVNNIEKLHSELPSLEGVTN